MGRNDAIISVLIKFLIIGLITFKNQMQEKSIMNFIFFINGTPWIKNHSLGLFYINLTFKVSKYSKPNPIHFSLVGKHLRKDKHIYNIEIF